MSNITQSDLDGFCGTENWYRHWTRRMVFTDGIKFMADELAAHWLIDVVASYQPELVKNERLHEFQVWRVERTLGTTSGVTVTCRGDSGEKPAITQVIEYSDFPENLMPFEFWVEPMDETVMCMLLKSEH